MIHCVETKKNIREELRARLLSLSSARRENACLALKQELYPLLASYSYVLSFSSLPHEIDTSLLNAQLALEKRLVLPKVEGEHLHLYQVERLDQLAVSSYNILEPIPTLAQQVNLADISCVLVPALGFDKHNHRVGYGKGYYDRLIASGRRTSQALTCIGLGFQELHWPTDFPSEPYDQRLDSLFLR